MKPRLSRKFFLILIIFVITFSIRQSVWNQTMIAEGIKKTSIGGNRLLTGKRSGFLPAHDGRESRFFF
jgi:hypothetical protein